MPEPAVTVVVRAKDEAPSIGRVLDLLAAQRVDGGKQIVVVDSGSSDGTPAIARDHGAEVIEIPAEEFTFGRSLNLGARAAAAPIVVALSAHAFPLDDRWLARMAAHFEDERVACATGVVAGPDNATLHEVVLQDWILAQRNPFWGYSNGAGGFRADLWRQREFREDMPGTEDKEWGWHWMTRGFVTIMDPALVVEHTHARDPLADLYRRGRREWEGFAMYLDFELLTPRRVLNTWWNDVRDRTPWRARMDPWRTAEMAGRFVGGWRGAHTRDK